MKTIGNIIYVIAGLWLLFSLVSCNDKDSFGSGTLTFETTTLSLDTCFSTIPTPHKTLMVYNNSGDGIRISRVYLEKMNQTGFRVNVNGTYLGSDAGFQAREMELREGDSLRVFVELTSRNNGDTVPKLLEDRLMFQLENGTMQYVTLNAYSWDAILMKDATLKKDSVISNVHHRPVVVYGTLTVDTNATVTIAKGTTMYFHSGAGIRVNGTLRIQGEKNENDKVNEVTLRCDRLDRMVSNLTYDNNPGQWGGIHFTEISHDNEFDYVDIHGATDAVVCDSAKNQNQTTLTLRHTTIHNTKGVGLSSNSCNILMENTQISNTFGNCLSILGGNVEMTHCTIAQYYPFDSARGYAMSFHNRVETIDYPLTLRAYNCLIKGYADDVMLWSATVADKAPIDATFTSCILRTSAPDGYQYMFKDCTFEDPNNSDYYPENSFVLFDTDNFFYDFTPKENTLPISKANGEFTLPTDRKGNERYSDQVHDIGCFETVKKP